MTKKEFISNHLFEQQDTHTFHMFNIDKEEIYLVFNSDGVVIEEHGIKTDSEIDAIIKKYLDDLQHNEYQEQIKDNYVNCGVKPQDFF